MYYRIIDIPTTPSTSSLLRHYVDEGVALEGDVVITPCQTAGRGQIGNYWESLPNHNISMSILLEPRHIAANTQFLLSQIISVAIVQLLNRYANGFMIKWPNDIYWNNYKIGGILIENDLMGQTIFRSIIGIGININQLHFESDAPNPISLSSITNEVYDLQHIIQEILTVIGELYQLSYSNPQEIISRYKNSLYRGVGVHSFIADGILFEASIADILPSGHLVLNTTQGETRTFAFKEVGWIL